MMDPERLMGGTAVWIAPAAIVVALSVGATAGLGPALLVLASAMLLAVVLLLWSSLGRLTGESPLTLEEALGLAAPSPEEERKRSILRALKDLEYERSVGKISEEDYAALGARYRTDAKELLRTIEAEAAPLRQKAEARLAARLKKDVAPGKLRKKAARATPTERSCSACASPNDVDARFCKRCGAVLQEDEDPA